MNNEYMKLLSNYVSTVADMDLSKLKVGALYYAWIDYAIDRGLQDPLTQSDFAKNASGLFASYGYRLTKNYMTLVDRDQWATKTGGPGQAILDEMIEADYYTDNPVDMFQRDFDDRFSI